jgi:hypothetical protein
MRACVVPVVAFRRQTAKQLFNQQGARMERQPTYKTDLYARLILELLSPIEHILSWRLGLLCL